MKNNLGISGVTPVDDSFTEKWFSQEISLTTGLYQFTYDGQWHCPFASDSCYEILNCTSVDFPESFQRLCVRTDYHGPEETIASILHKITISQKSSKFICIRPLENGKRQYIKGVMAVFQGQDGPLSVFGQITDVSEAQTMSLLLDRMEAKKKERQQIFQIVAQHSNRTLYAYDIATGTTRPWDAESEKNDILAHLYASSYTDENLEKNQGVLPDSVADVKKFFASIHNGTPSGDLNIHIRLTDGQAKWYHFKYTSLFDNGKPTTALISIEDITERHEHELAYLRYIQSVETDAEGKLLHIESCLTEDKVEKLSGQMLSTEEKQIFCSHSDIKRLLLGQKFQYEDPEEAARYFSCENLLALYAQGNRQLNSEWKVHFNDGTTHWLDTKVVLMKDPYNGCVKAFIRMLDITKKREEHLSILQRAEYDAMTGLLRRDSGEARIKKYLSQDSEKGGFLIILDLDDLKSINDTLGHRQGDTAIIGIANILKSHFRKDDILIRAGGDEFIVFLPGAGQSMDSMEITMTSLLQKLARTSIGEGAQCTIHCSAGCAAEEPGADTFDTLFHRADIALYHVKRSGKNNFAFYVPEMDLANYEFRSKKLLSSQNLKKFELVDLQYLLESIMKFYQLVLSVNLSANTYYMMEEVKDGVFAHIPDFGTLDSFVDLASKAIHPKDHESYFDRLSRKALLLAYEDGAETVHCHFRFHDRRYRWVECMVIFYTSESGDICNFTLLRWAEEQANELERLRLQKILELSAGSDLEYICLIDVLSRHYSTFSRNSDPSHVIPEAADFDEVTKFIRDTQVPPEDRDAYYANASLDHVFTRMNGTEERYSYRYTLTDGVTREAAFTWYEDSHFELLMTVRKLP